MTVEAVRQFTITCLGTGTSHGIPMINCDCPVCRSSDPRDTRHRCSAQIEYGGRSIIIDTAPEFRLQCLANDVRRVDAILFTHAHADHVFGLDDVRRFSSRQGRPIPCYGSARTLETLRTLFPYAVEGCDDEYYSERPRIELNQVEGPFELFGVQVTPVPLYHGRDVVLGYRIGPIAYCTDCSDIPPASRELLRDLDVLVLDGLRYTPHPTHFNVEQAIEAARQIGAKKTYLTHIAHELMHARLAAELPSGIEPAYDGLRVVVPVRCD